MIRNVNRIDHVAALIRPENLEAVAARMAEALRTTFYGPFDRPAAGLRIATSLDAGIELVSPLTDDPANPLNRMLAERGEHWMSVVFGVSDMAEACDHLARLGYTPRMRRQGFTGEEPYAHRVTSMEQAMFDPALSGGLPFALCCIEEREEVE
jgi:hypothetical protein